LESGDKVVTRKTFHGTHTGQFLGLAPTGHKASWDVIDIVRIKDGKMVEHWDVTDVFGLLMQLGAISSSV
jgi:predicted ester cyclase